MNQDMEKALQRALQRKQPPDGFAARIMARLPESESAGGPGEAAAGGPARGKVVVMPARRRAWLAIGLAASLAAGSFAGLRYQQYRQGQEATRQLMLALHITGEKLTLAQHKVVGVSERRVDQ